MQSPCYTCEHKDRDKSDPGCVDCRPRIEHAVAQGMLSPEVLEVQDDPVVLEARQKGGRPRGSFKEKQPCSTPDCRWDAQIKGLCRSCYGEIYRKSHKHCKGCGRRKKIKARNRCSTCYVRWRYHNPDAVRGYRKRGL